MKKAYPLATLLSLLSLNSALAGVQIIPVDPSPQPVHASLRIMRPEDEATVGRNPVTTTIRVRGYGLGDASDYPRSDELPLSRMGQALHVVVDNRPYFAYNGPAIDPFNQQGDYYEDNYQFSLKPNLEEGMHALRVFPCRSYGEGLKTLDCFDAIIFFVGDKKMDWSMSLRRPFLTYNEPGPGFTYTEEFPVLLDFYASNCELSSDGYRVRLTLDDSTTRVLPELRPYYIYGLEAGAHTVRLELIDVHNQPVPGAFNDVKRSFMVR
jgi:hypothetical protein